MSNHIHLIARAKECYILSDIIRDFKKFTAKEILNKIQVGIESRRDWILKRFEFAAKQHIRNSNYQVWTHENHAIELISKKFIDQKLNFIHKNPVRAKIVTEAIHYVYRSARNYAGLDSVLEIDFL